MSITPEKNDVDVSKLFMWSKPISISFGGKNITGYVRLVGDAELNRARVFSLRKSKELRTTLKNLESDERMAYLADPDSMTKENLVEYIVFTKTRDIVQQASKEVEIPWPKEPSSEASLEEQEKYQAEVDKFPKTYDDELRKLTDIKLNNERRRLGTLTDEQLYKEYETNSINYLCETEMYKRFKEMCVYFCTFTDKKLKNAMFESYEQFENLPTQLKEAFIAEYDSLEIGLDELKK